MVKISFGRKYFFASKHVLACPSVKKSTDIIFGEEKYWFNAASIFEFKTLSSFNIKKQTYTYRITKTEYKINDGNTAIAQPTFFAILSFQISFANFHHKKIEPIPKSVPVDEEIKPVSKNS